MTGQDGNEEDDELYLDELFLDVNTDSDDGIPKPEGPQSLNANGEGLVLTITLDLIIFN
jgi:hypothetical protein